MPCISFSWHIILVGIPVRCWTGVVKKGHACLVPNLRQWKICSPSWLRWSFHRYIRMSPYHVLYFIYMQLIICQYTSIKKTPKFIRCFWKELNFQFKPDKASHSCLLLDHHQNLCEYLLGFAKTHYCCWSFLLPLSKSGLTVLHFSS